MLTLLQTITVPTLLIIERQQGLCHRVWTLITATHPSITVSTLNLLLLAIARTMLGIIIMVHLIIHQANLTTMAPPRRWLCMHLHTT